MSTLSIPLTDLSAQQIADLEAMGLIKLEGNGQAPTPAPKEDKTWTNVSGYVCSWRGAAWSSSNKVVRHLNGSCWCRKGGDAQCKGVSKGYVKPEEFNTRPGAKIVQNDAERTFTIG